MADFIESFGISREARISIILNTFMYIDKCTKCDTMPSLRTVVQELIRDDSLNDEQMAALNVMRKCMRIMQDSEVWDFRVISFSEHMEEKYRGAYAAAFKKADDSEIYVVFRGTGSGRWYDNGDGLSNERTRYQLAALLYFNNLMRSEKCSPNARLIVTGHSKGGNLSQYVTLASEYGTRVKYCISFDGQGFSPEFLRSINYPNSSAIERCNRMYSICGDNDYVNVLGKKVIPDDQTVFIKTRTRLTDLYGAHSIIPPGTREVDAHWCDYLFDFSANRFNDQTSDEQRELANCAKAVSMNAMEMPHDEREDVCRTLMTLAEKFIGGNNSSGGLNGEKAELEESVGFVTNLCEIIRPLTLRLTSKIKNDVIYSLLVVPAGNGADPSMGSAPMDKKIKYILSDPEIMKLYYLGASVALESFAENVTQAGSALSLGGISGFSSKIEELVSSCDNAVDAVSSSCESSDNALSGYISEFFSVRDRFLKQSGGSNGDMGTSYSEWKSYFTYQDAEGRKVTRVSGNQRSVLGSDNDDVIRGFTTNDTIHGYGGNDVLYGGPGNDAVYGAGGNDVIYGEEGDDDLYGGNDSDIIYGGPGNDLIRGGGGSDTLYGGPGDDIYLFSPGCGRDVISDNEGCNTIMFSKVQPSQLRSSINGSGELVIEMQGTSDCIRIQNYSSGRYRFVFDDDSYILTGQGSELAFTRQ
ncbi:Mbeg1-like protein [Ruminococcus sp.]|uniref:Mbeg1-like protein n=1 Tax=Ruminococcus sp. TaxID=41978 RepID=UPI0025E37ACF|nr:Mbeg1-like protein [Ruminococcus sp.]